MRTLILPLVLIVALAGCEEENPGVILDEGQVALLDSTYVTTDLPAAQEKTVVFEEFSGVKCSNCPLGNQATADLIDAHGERFVPIVYHTDFLGTPFSGDIDMRTEDGQRIEGLLESTNKPSASIDRRIFDVGRVSTTVNAWDARVDEQLSAATTVNVDLEKLSYEETDRLLRFRLTITYLTDVSSAQALTMGFTEDGLVAAQLDGSTVIPDYVHDHIFRSFITPYQGEPITEPTEEGRVIIQEFAVELDEAWDDQKLALFAFVHDTGTDLEVRQGRFIKIKD